jgi:hypothetical protein
MKKFKIVLFLSAMMALSVGGFVNSQIENGIELQSIEQLMTINKAVAGDESGGNQATCYSSYTDAGWFGGTNIWVCGSCVQIKAKSFFDQGTCNF